MTEKKENPRSIELLESVKIDLANLELTIKEPVEIKKTTLTSNSLQIIRELLKKATQVLFAPQTAPQFF